MDKYKVIRSSIIYAASLYAGITGYQIGCRYFEKVVPEAMAKIEVGKMVYTALSDDDEEEG